MRDEEEKTGEPRAPRGVVPPQVTRLILLTVAIVASYFIARHFLVPRSFGQYGWYRGAALQELSVRPFAYAGRKTCVECHDEVAAKMAKANHARISCESCHGPNQTHADDPTSTPAKIDDPRFCLRCHRADPARPVTFPQIEPAEHNPKEVCMRCHQPHAPMDAPAPAPQPASAPAPAK